MIKVEGLTKSFGPQKVLRELSLDVATGTITIVIGRSGGGKSVFLKHLIGLFRPDAGRIMVDGVDISRLRGRDLDEIRRTYGVVFQGGALFDSMSCFDKVAMLHEGRIVEVGPPAAIQGSTNPVVQKFIKGEPDTGS